MSRKAGLAAVACIAAIVGAAGLAWACTTFSRIDLGASAARPGTEVSVRGENAVANSPVTLRWDSRTAPVVAQATTDGAGTFTTSVKVPEAAPLGVHVLLATDAGGNLARGALEVVGASGERVEARPVFGPATGTAGTDWFQAGAALLALAALAAVPLAGLVVLGRRPATAPARRRQTVAGTDR